MDGDQILAFVTIAQLRSFTRAAAALHRSQPAISRRIGLLEHELGAPLLERLRGSIQLTELGRVFLPHAESMLASIHDGEDVLNLAMVGTLLDMHLVELLRRFSQRSKKVLVNLTTSTSQGVSRLVRRGDACMGIRYFPESSATLISHTIDQETMRVVVSAKHSHRARRHEL